MLFAVTAIDKPDSQDIRLANRPAHVAFLGEHKEMVKAAGPYLTEDGTGMTGSLLILEAEDRAAVDAFLAADPYAKAGLFASTDVRRWRWTVNAPA